MCGIAGMFGEADRDTVEDMVQCLEHRGPDGDGFYEDDGIAMGMRRLAIIDPEGGDQPIHNEDETVWVVFNGEIYNYPELREELEEQGHEFYTDADTEVLVHLYEEHGPGFVERLNGMFAFALWDTEEEALRLYRDRLGIKPLYYAERDGTVSFGSEPRSLLNADLPAEPDEEGLSYYWHLRYIPAPYTAFEGMRKLEPGHYLTISDGGVSKTRYWMLPAVDEEDRGKEFYVERLRELLDDAVERRMLADVPLGAFLSGGIDSSTVVGLMSRHSDDPVKTFSVGFAAEEHDESSHARHVAEHFGADHTEYTVDLSTADMVEDVLAGMDEPLADPAVIPTYLIAEKAAQDVKVVNTGSGADELFAGYRRYIRDATNWRRMRYVPGPVKTVIRKISAVLPEKSKPWFYATYIGSTRSQAENYATLQTRTTDVPHEDLADVREMVDAVFDDEADIVQNLTAFDITYWLPGDLLVKVDRATMLNSLEARVPFLDHRLVEFSREMPTAYKIEGGTEKAILREAVADLLPDRILEREKDGFGVPVGAWMRDGALADRFTRDRFEQVPIIDADTVMDRYDAFLDGADVHENYLWKALNLQIWYEEWVAGDAR